MGEKVATGCAAPTGVENENVDNGPLDPDGLFVLKFPVLVIDPIIASGNI